MFNNKTINSSNYKTIVNTLCEKIIKARENNTLCQFLTCNGGNPPDLIIPNEILIWNLIPENKQKDFQADMFALTNTCVYLRFTDKENQIYRYYQLTNETI